MRFLVSTKVPTALVKLNGTCGRYGIALAVPGIGPPPFFFLGLATNFYDLAENVDQITPAGMANFHFTTGGFAFPPGFGPLAGGNVRVETMILSPFSDDLYAIAVPTAPGGDVYIDVTIFERGQGPRGKCGLVGYQI